QSPQNHSHINEDKNDNYRSDHDFSTSGNWTYPILRLRLKTPFAIGRAASALPKTPFAIGRAASALRKTPFAIRRTRAPKKPFPELTARFDKTARSIARMCRPPESA